jgi:hypothetical protein
MPTSRTRLLETTCVLLTAALLPLPILANAPHIRNTTPAEGPRTIQLEEIWRAGGGDDGILFGQISEAVAGPDGNVYLLDSQLCHVEVIGPDGEHVGTLSREGDGPGEVRVPRDVVFLDDGTVGIATLFPARLVRVTTGDTPAPVLNLGAGGTSTGMSTTIACEYRGGTLLLVGQHDVPSDVGRNRTQYLASFDADGEERARFFETSMVMNFQSDVIVERDYVQSFFFAHAIGPDGRVYAARSRDDYAIDVYRPDGTLEHVIERSFAHRERTDREMRRARAVLDSALRQVAREVRPELAQVNPVVAALFVDADGNLWVKHSRSGDDRPEGIMLTYDLFDPEGRYLQEVSIACDGDPLYDDLEFLVDGRVLMIKGAVLAQWSSFDFGTVDWNDEEDVAPMEAVCYRMK